MIQPQNNDTSRSIAIYCRVSTDEQAREGVSLHEQEERLKAYCRAMGWEADPVMFVDDGYSAKDTERPKLTKLINSVKKGHISKVMVTKLDRMSRKLLDLLNLIDLFQQHEVSFISISESFDTNTPSGRLTLQVLGAVAEFERERIRERVFENMYHAASGGKWLTQSPYGYNLEQKNLVIDEEEAKVVREIFDLYLHKGKGYYAIAKHLNEKGIPSKYKKEWSLRSVKLMLTNPVYKGTLVWNRQDSSKKNRKTKDESDWVIVEDAVPSIVDKITWERVQEKTTKKQMAPRAQTSPHLLGGLLKCGNCGSGMSIGWSGSKNKRYRVYRCSANKNKGTCTSKQYRADEVEEWFKEGLDQIMKSNTSYLQLLIKEKVSSTSTTNTEHKIRTAKARYKRKVEAYTAGLIELNDLEEEKQRMETVIMSLEESKSEDTSIQTKELERQLSNQIKTVIQSMDNLPIPEAKSLLKTIVSKVIVKGEKEIEIVLSLD